MGVCFAVVSYLSVKYLPAVKPFAIRQVEELFAAVEDCLVERHAGFFQYFQQLFRPFGDVAVGRFAFRVLRVFNAAGQQVDRFVAVAACDGDCTAVAVAKRLEQVGYKVFQRLKGLWVRYVFKTVFDGNPAVCEFFEGEISTKVH